MASDRTSASCPLSRAFSGTGVAPRRRTTQEAQMPLFFIIAIGAGAFALGATTVDVTSDMRQQRSSAQAVPANFQPSAYPTQSECVNAAAARVLPATACQMS